MYCMHCGKQIADDSIFCEYCGQPVEEALAPSSAPAQPAAAPAPAQAGANSASSQAAARPACAQPAANPSYAQPVGSTVPMQPAVNPVPVQAAAAQPKKSNPAPFIIAGIAAVLLVCVGVYFAVGGCSSLQHKSSSASFANGTPKAAQNDSANAAADGNEATKDGSSTSSESESSKKDAKDSSADASKKDAANSDSKSSKASSSGDYVLPDSSTRYYSRQELSRLSNWDLYIARNEVFARYGRGFKNDDLREYFNSKSWYVQRYTPEEFDAKWGENALNDCELKNVELIKDIERANGSPYLS